MNTPSRTPPRAALLVGLLALLSCQARTVVIVSLSGLPETACRVRVSAQTDAAFPAHDFTSDLARFSMELPQDARGPLSYSGEVYSCAGCLLGTFMDSVALDGEDRLLRDLSFRGTGGGCLQVKKTGAGAASGRITVLRAGGAALTCGDPCVVSVTKGKLTLRAQGDDRTYFVGWGAPCARPASPECEITLSADTTVTATFARKVCTPGGSGFCWDSPLPHGWSHKAAFVAPSGDIWVGGEHGSLLRYRASEGWASQSTPTEETISGVWVSPETEEVWAVGKAGSVLHSLPGGDFETQKVPGTAKLNAIWGADADHLWVVGDNATAYSLSDGVWKNETKSLAALLGKPAAPPHLLAISGVDAQQVYVSGHDGTLLAWNGSAWRQLEGNLAAPTDKLNGVLALGASDLFVHSELSNLYRLTESGWATLTLPLNPTWGLWGRPGANGGVFFVGRGLARWDGQQAQLDDLPQRGINSDPADHLAVGGSANNNVWAVGDLGALSRWDGRSWSTQERGVYGAKSRAWLGFTKITRFWEGPQGTVFAVSVAGQLLRYDGSTWSALYEGEALPKQGADHPKLSGLAGLGDTLYAIGESGVILKLKGVNGEAAALEVSRIDNGVMNATLNALARVGGDLWAVGEGGVMLQLVQGAFVLTNPMLPRGNLRGVWGSDERNVWVVGDQPERGQEPTLLHFDGASWKSESGPLLAALGAATLGSHLLAVAGAAPDDVFVVSSNGVIARRQGQAWTHFATLNDLSSSSTVEIWAHPQVSPLAPPELWAAYNHNEDTQGYVQHFKNWAQEPEIHLAKEVLTILPASSGDLFVGGASGILHRPR